MYVVNEFYSASFRNQMMHVWSTLPQTCVSIVWWEIWSFPVRHFWNWILWHIWIHGKFSLQCASRQSALLIFTSHKTLHCIEWRICLISSWTLCLSISPSWPSYSFHFRFCNYLYTYSKYRRVLILCFYGSVLKCWDEYKSERFAINVAEYSYF